MTDVELEALSNLRSSNKDKRSQDQNARSEPERLFFPDSVKDINSPDASVMDDIAVEGGSGQSAFYLGRYQQRRKSAPSLQFFSQEELLSSQDAPVVEGPSQNEHTVTIDDHNRVDFKPGGPSVHGENENVRNGPAFPKRIWNTLLTITAFAFGNSQQTATTLYFPDQESIFNGFEPNSSERRATEAIQKSPTNNVSHIRRIKHLRQEYRARRIVRRSRMLNSFRLWLFRDLINGNSFRSYLKRMTRNRHALLALVCLILDFVVDVAICSLAIAEIQIASSYQNKWYYVDEPIWLWFSFVSLSIYNCFVAITRIIASTNRLQALFSVLTLIDLITAVPYILSLFFENGDKWSIPSYFRVWTAVHRLKLVLNLKTDTVLIGATLDPLTIRLIDLISSAVAFIFTWACLFQRIELVMSDVKYGMIDSLYVVVITTATVGYGDIVPKAMLSRLVVIVMIILAIAFFPRIINGIIETYRVRKEGKHSYVVGHMPFVVIFLSYSRDQFCEDVLRSSLYSLTKKTKFVCKSSTSSQTHNVSLSSTSYQIVLVSNQVPSTAIKTLLSSRRYTRRVTFVQGSALEELDLKRAGVRSAAACFVLSDRSKEFNAHDATEEDHLNVLRVWSLRKYAPRIPVYVSNLRPETDIHVRPVSRQVVCVNSIKQLIFGMACLHKGSAVLLSNLVHNAPPLSQYTKLWQVHYADGLNNTIHLGPFNPLFYGKRFSELSWYLFAEFQIILIGVRFRVPAQYRLETDPRGANSQRFTYRDHIVLNPGCDYIFVDNGTVKELVFVAQSVDDVVDIEHLDEEQFNESWIRWKQTDFEFSGPSTTTHPFFIQAHDHNEHHSKCPCGLESKIKAIVDPRQGPVEHGSSVLKEAKEHGFSRETYIGHPRPPHHMVIDNELQSPFCHMLKKPSIHADAHLCDATLNETESCSTKNPQNGRFLKLDGHILVCCSNFDVWTYLCTMRAAHLPIYALKPILFLCPNLPSEDDWRPLSVFPLVFFIQGHALKRNDMIRAGLFSSSLVLMLKHPQKKSGSSLEERAVDSTSIMATHQIDFMIRDKYVITELFNRNNIKFLRAKIEMLDYLPILACNPPMTSIKPMDISHVFKRFTFRRNVAHGEMVTQSDSGSTESEADQPGKEGFAGAFAPTTATEPFINTEEPGYYANSVVFASGRVLPSDMFDGLAFDAFRTPGLIDVVKLLCGRRYQRWQEVNEHLKLNSSILHSIPIPKCFIGLSFSTLYHHLSTAHGIVTLAVYRQRTIANITPSLQSPTQQRTFSIPMRRTFTDMSMRSGTSYHRHLFQMEPEPIYTRDKSSEIDSYSGSPWISNNWLTWNHLTGSKAPEALSKLLHDSNTIDNELPYLITNPLPDLILDELDMVFILQVVSGNITDDYRRSRRESDAVSEVFSRIIAVTLPDRESNEKIAANTSNTVLQNTIGRLELQHIIEKIWQRRKPPSSPVKPVYHQTGASSETRRHSSRVVSYHQLHSLPEQHQTKYSVDAAIALMKQLIGSIRQYKEQLNKIPGNTTSIGYPAVTKFGAKESSRERSSVVGVQVPKSESDGVWANFDLINGLINDLIVTDCTFITNTYDDLRIFKHSYASFRPSRPPFILHKLILDLSWIVLDHIYTPNALVSFAFTILQAFQAYPCGLHASLMKFLSDGWMSRLLDIKKSIIHGTDLGVPLLSVYLEDTLFDSALEPSLEKTEVVDVQDVQVSVSSLANSKKGSTRLESEQTIPSANPYRGFDKKWIMKASESLPTVNIETTAFPSILMTILGFKSNRLKKESFFSINELFYLDRLIFKMVDIRPDVPHDLLEIIASGNDLLITKCVTLLTRHWHRSAGHLIISDSLIPWNEAEPEFINEDSEQSLDKSGKTKNVKPRPRHQDKVMNTFLPFMKPPPHTKESEQHKTNIAGHTMYPHWFLDNDNTVEACELCGNTICGFAAVCHGCSEMYHFSCYSKLWKDVRHIAEPHYLVYSLIGEDRLELSESMHHFQNVNIFTCTLCDICSLPLFGLSVQGKLCPDCGLVMHHACCEKVHEICTKKFNKTRKCMIPSDLFNKSVCDFFGNLLFPPPREVITQAFKEHEIVAIYESLSLQKYILLSGLESKAITIKYPLDATDPSELFDLVCPELAKSIAVFADLMNDLRDKSSLIFSFGKLSVLAMKMKLPSDLDEFTNNIWESSLHPNLSTIDGPNSTVSSMCSSANRPNDVMALLKLFPEQKFSDLKAELFFGDDMTSWLSDHLQLQNTLIGGFLLQQMTNYGFFDRTDGRLYVDAVYMPFPKPGEIQSAYISPIPHPLDSSIGAETLIASLQSLLLRSVNASVNEFGLILLRKRFNPYEWDQVLSEFPAKSTEAENLTDSRIHFVRTSRLIQSIMWAAIVWYTRDPVNIISSSIGGHYSDGNFMDSYSLKGRVSYLKYIVAVREKLSERYLIPWFMNVSKYNPEFYDLCILNATICQTPDPYYHSDKTDWTREIHSRIKILKSSGILTGKSWRSIISKWLDEIYKQSSSRSSDYGIDLQLNDVERNCVYEQFGAASAELDSLRSLLFDQIGDGEHICPTKTLAYHRSLDYVFSSCSSLRLLEVVQAAGTSCKLYYEIASAMAASNWTISSFVHLLKLVWQRISMHPSDFTYKQISQILNLAFTAVQQYLVVAFDDLIQGPFINSNEASRFLNVEHTVSFLRLSFMLDLFSIGCPILFISKICFFGQYRFAGLGSEQEDKIGIVSPAPSTHIILTLTKFLTASRLSFYEVALSECAFMYANKSIDEKDFLRKRVKLSDARLDCLKYMFAYLEFAENAEDLAETLGIMRETLVPVIWDYLNPHYDSDSLFTTSLFRRLLIFDCSLGKEVPGITDENPTSNLESSLFHACVYQTMESDVWQSRYAALDNLYGLFLKLDDDVISCLGEKIWLLGPFSVYFIQCLEDENTHVRLKAMSYIRSFDGSTLTYLINCWGAFFKKCPGRQQSQLLNQMISLNSMFPGLRVLDWGTVISCLKKKQKQIITKDTVITYDDVFHVHEQTDLSKAMADVENVKLLSFTLAFQMLANGVEISYDFLVQLEANLFSALGFEFRIGSDNWVKLNLEKRPSFNSSDLSQRSLFLIIMRLMKRVYDKYIVSFAVSKTDDDRQILSTSRDLDYLENVDMGKLTFLKQRIFPFTQERKNEANSQVAVNTCANTFVYFELAFSVISTPHTLQHLDSTIIKAWLDVVLIYIYKFDLDEPHVSAKVAEIALLLIESVNKNILCEKNINLVIIICTILLKRSTSITIGLLPKAISSFGRLITRYKYHKTHPINISARKFLKTSFDKYADTGLFVLLLKSDQIADDYSAESTTSREPDIFFVFRVVLGYSESGIDEDVDKEDVSLYEKPIDEVVRRLFLFSDFEQNDFNIVITNLVRYIEHFRPKTVKRSVIQNICSFLFELTTRTYEWHKRTWNVSPLILFCALLLDLYPSHLKVLYPAIRAFLMFAISFCSVEKGALTKLLISYRKVAGKIDVKLDGLSRYIFSELKTLLRSGPRAEFTFAVLLQMLSEDNDQAVTTERMPVEFLIGFSDGTLFHDLVVFQEKLFFTPSISDDLFRASYYATTIMVENWDANSGIHNLLFPSTRQKAVFTNSLQCRRALHFLNLILLSLCYNQNMGLILTLLQHQETVGEYIRSGFIRASYQLIDQRVEGEVRPDLGMNTSVPNSDTLLNDTSLQLASCEPLNRSVLALKCWVLLCALTKYSLSISEDDEQDEQQKKTLLHFLDHGANRMWTFLWPTFRKLLVDTGDVLKTPLHSTFWNAFLDVIVFLYEIRSDILILFKSELFDLLLNHEAPLLQHPSLRSKLKIISQYLSDLFMPSRVDIILRTLQSDLREAICS